MSENLRFPSPIQARSAARGLGWFSIGLGLVELLAARRVARAVGLPGRGTLIAACGAREVANGIGLLRSDAPAPWLWGRVAGDAVDMAALATALPAPAHQRKGAAVALAVVAGLTVVDVMCARAAARKRPKLTAAYSGRSGWPKPAAQMRGAAVADFMPARDMRIPEALRPWASGAPAAGASAFDAVSLNG